jgi:WD40 repeat protein
MTVPIVRLILIACLASIASCQKLSNQVNSSELLCGALADPDADYVRIQDPNGRILEGQDIELIDPGTGEKSDSPKISAKGCLQITKGEKWLVKAKGHPWMASIGSDQHSSNGILALRVADKQQLTLNCSDLQRVNSSFALEQLFDTSQVRTPEAFVVRYKLKEQNFEETFVLDAKQSHPLFSSAQKEAVYSLQVNLADIVTGTSTDYSCRLELDNTAPKLRLDYGPETLAEWKGIKFHKIDRSQRLSFHAPRQESENDVSLIEYCASSFETFSAFRTALERPAVESPCQETKKTSDILTQITDRNEGFWIIYHRAVDLANNTGPWVGPFPLLYYHGAEFTRLEAIANPNHTLGTLRSPGGPKRLLVDTLEAFSIRDKSLTTDYERQLADETLFKIYGFAYEKLPYFIEAKRIQSPDDFINTFDITPDGEDIISSSSEGLIRRWQLSSGALLDQTISAYKGNVGYAISPDGKSLLLANSSQGISLWDLSTFGLRSPFVPLTEQPVGTEQTAVTKVVFSPDGSKLLVEYWVFGADGSGFSYWREGMQVRDAATLNSLASIIGPASNTIQVPAGSYFLPNGTILSAGQDGKITLLGPDSNYSQAETIESPNRFSELYLLKDGKTMLTTGWGPTGRAQYWESSSWKFLGDGPEEWAGMGNVALSKDDRMMAAVFQKQAIKLYDRPKQRLLQAEFPTELLEPRRLQFSPDAKKLVALFESNLMSIWIKPPSVDEQIVDSGTKYDDGILYTGVALSPDQSKLIAGSVSGIIEIYEKSTGIKRQTLKTDKDRSVLIRDLAMSPDGKLLAASCDDDILRVWNVSKLDQDVQFPMRGLPVSTFNLEFVNDTTLLVADKNGLKLFDAETGTLIREGLTQDEGRYFRRFDEGRKAVVASKKSIRFWDLEKSVPLGDAIPLPSTVTGIAIDSKEEYLAVGLGGGHFTIHLYHIPSRTEFGKPLKGHRDTVVSLQFLQDGKLVSASFDKTIKVWDVRTENLLLNLEKHTGEIYSLAPGESPYSFYSSSWDGSIRLWSFDFESLPQRICAAIGPYLQGESTYCASPPAE